MNRLIRVYATRATIEDAIQRHLPDVSFGITGDGRDYAVYFTGLDETEGDVLDDLFGETIYGDGDADLAATLVDLLDEYGIRMSVAESCTGGMLASALVDRSGASEVFYEGLVTYSNSAKIDRLGVGEDTLYDYGAVSEETALEMANGLLNDNVAIGVSTTGIAGPGGGTNEKPVGLVYIAVVSENGSEVFRNVFEGGRNDVRRQARDTALFYTIRHIKKYF